MRLASMALRIAASLCSSAALFCDRAAIAGSGFGVGAAAQGRCGRRNGRRRAGRRCARGAGCRPSRRLPTGAAVAAAGWSDRAGAAAGSGGGGAALRCRRTASRRSRPFPRAAGPACRARRSRRRADRWPRVRGAARCPRGLRPRDRRPSSVTWRASSKLLRERSPSWLPHRGPHAQPGRNGAVKPQCGQDRERHHDRFRPGKAEAEIDRRRRPKPRSPPCRWR